ncbi:MAG TPA: helix-turn-helix transcriptional regulator [Gemmatimonadaceae bacterium]|nr:helix-turn-helix transcriptional regulator [Gemmatimonadaceae bacterium]
MSIDRFSDLIALNGRGALNGAAPHASKVGCGGDVGDGPSNGAPVRPASAPPGAHRPVRSADVDGAVARYHRLTARERDVLRLIAEGYSAPEIGELLSISAKTVDTYKHRINEKLGVTHRTEYVRLALRLGILKP